VPKPQNPDSALGATLNGSHIRLDVAVRLAPVSIAKPWGREVWYTGIEARGESQVLTESGALGLSQYLELAPDRLCGNLPLTLLKILEPNPQPVVGDLYFELHDEKQEVYIVTHIDPAAWPEGKGRIRLGMSQIARKAYANDQAFRAAYLQAVKAYEKVRRKIDEQNGTPAPELAAREVKLRQAMDAFTELRAVAVGDIVVVPTGLPHALQHGVRVIEFQTPTYERNIISFAQKVLTQDHWDSERAIARMRLDPPVATEIRPLATSIDEVTGLKGLGMWRIRLAPGETMHLPDHPSYAICMVAAGMLKLGPLVLEAEQAAFVPGWLLDKRRTLASTTVANPTDVEAIILIAAADL
jgi:hypothetical protein